MATDLKTIGSLDAAESTGGRRASISWTALGTATSRPERRRYQRVLLLNPAATLHRTDLPRCTYPLGIGYLAAVLEQHGYEVAILDVFAEGYHHVEEVDGDPAFLRYGLPDGDVVRVLRRFGPDVVGVSSIFSNQADNVHHLLALARGELPDVATALGGAHARYFPKTCLEDRNLDAVFLGEAEHTFLTWLEHLNGAVPADQLRGLAFRDRAGDVQLRPELPLISSVRPAGPAPARVSPVAGTAGELDGIPYPAWHLYNMERYFALRAYQSPYTVGTRVGQLYTSRGCTAHCTFCTTTNFWGNQLRRRSVANVVGEVLALRDRYRIDEFHIQDDNITNDMDHARELFRVLREVGLPWATPQGTALWRMDENLLDLMAASGAYQVTFAIESGVQRVLRELVRKPLDLARTRHLIGHARALGLHVHGFFIIGMPPMYGHAGESLAEMQQSFDYAAAAQFDSASFFAASPIVGSELLRESLRQGFVDRSVALYRMTYKQGIIDVPGLWDGAQIAELAARFNREFNQSKVRRNSIRQWDPAQY